MLKETRMISAIKKKHRVISLEDKLHMINKYEAGITKAKIVRDYGLNELTVRHILDHAANYKQLGQSALTSSGSQMFRIAEIFKDKILNGDPNLDRSMKVCQEIENSIHC
jgi:predicted transcriptional regulator